METSKQKTVFGIVGGGWRAGFFLKIAQELPDRFGVCGVVTRSAEKGQALERQWGVKTYRTVAELLKQESPGFVVVSVLREVAPGFIEELAKNGVPVLSETPPCLDLDGLLRLNKLTEAGAKIQVAEQYPLQPLLSSQIAVANSGMLGRISETQVTLCHDYHAVSLIRKLLGIGFENAEISAYTFASPVIDGPDRNGEPTEEKKVDVVQTIARFDFGDRLAVYDFTKGQYFSYIRSKRLLVRGDRGEICDDGVKYLKDFKTPVEMHFKRMNAGENGNHEGYYLKGLLLGDEWVYKNPFAPCRLSDDEIAVALCMEKMGRFVAGGPEFYSLREASQDHYLHLMMRKAVETGEKTRTVTQPWAAV
jgi:predicted dehydrogenase